jgi:hypothetical protein
MVVREYQRSGRRLVKDIIKKIKEEIAKYSDPGPDDEECGYVQGLEDALRIINHQSPIFHREG